MSAAAVIVAAAGCGASAQRRAFEYMPDMARDPAYKAFAPNPVTRDGLTLQRPVAGTIARGYQPVHYGPGEDEAARRSRTAESSSREGADPGRRQGALRDLLPALSRRTGQRGRTHLRQDTSSPLLYFRPPFEVSIRADLSCHHPGRGKDA